MRFVVLLPVAHETLLRPFDGECLLALLVRRAATLEGVEKVLIAPGEGLGAACHAAVDPLQLPACVLEEAPRCKPNSRAELELVAGHLESTEAKSMLYLPPTISLLDPAMVRFALAHPTTGGGDLKECFAAAGCGFYLLRQESLPLLRDCLERRGAEASLVAQEIFSRTTSLRDPFVASWKRLCLRFWQIRKAFPLQANSGLTLEVFERLAARANRPLAELSIEEIFHLLNESPEFADLYPVSVHLEVATHNDAPPVYAPLANGADVGGRPAFLLPEVWTRVLEGMVRDYAGIGNLHLGGPGEPLLHPEIEGMLRSIAPCFDRLGGTLNEVNLSTDARHMNASIVQSIMESPLFSVMVSIDAVDPARYAAIRPGARIEEARNNLELLLAAKRERFRNRGTVQPAPVVAVATTLLSELEPHLTEFLEAFPARSECVRAGATPAQAQEAVRAFYNAGHMIEYAVIQGASTYAGQIPDRRATNYTPLRRIPCRRLGATLFVQTDGTVVPCDRVFRAEGALRIGNVLEENSLQDLWKKMVSLRAAHREGRPESALARCASCQDWYIPVD